MRALLIAVAAFLVIAAPASAQSLVINEVDYDQPSTDAAEFLEIKNVSTSAINLDPYQLRFVNGANGANYLTVNLPSVDLAGGDYYVVCANPATVANCDLDGGADTNLIQNGNPDGVVIENASGIADGLAYGGAMAGVGEGATAITDTDTLGRGIARIPDGCDTDNNSVDFARADITPGASNGEPACGGPPADAPPAVSDTAPDAGATQVPLDSNVTIEFSEPVDLAADAVSITCTDSGAHAATRSGGPTSFTFDPAADFVRNEVCTVTVSAAGVTDQDTNDPPDNMAAPRSFSFSTLGLALRIHDIQGAAHLSPHDGDFVAAVPGVVTAVTTNGYWIQDPQPDGDERTSEGVFVFTNSAPTATVNQSLLVSGQVDEFRPGGANGNNLTITEIVGPSAVQVGTGSVSPTVIGFGGRFAPISVIDNDAVGGSAENPGTLFDPRQDGLDFHESLEGMLVRLNLPRATGPTNGFGELSVVGDLGLFAFPHTLRGGLFVRPDDFNPERFILDGEAGFPTPLAHTGDLLASVNAVGHYSFGNYKYFVTTAPVVRSSRIKREETDPAKKSELAVASMNVENLDPGDPDAKFDELAEILVHNMKSPDIVAIEEVQDNNGAAAGDGTSATGSDASATYAEFIDAIDRVGGPAYDFRQINPAYNQDGGEPGGNIRVGFLFRTDRGVAFVDRPGGDATTPVAVLDTPDGAELSLSPGRIDPTNPAFNSSRKPLAGEFTWKGRKVIAVANHFNSKGGDDPLFGRFQPPKRVTEVQRHQQATVVADFVQDVLAADSKANVVVMGDLNDFDFSQTLDILEGGGLTNLMEMLPVWERYSYVFDGNSQTLDQILVTDALMKPKPEYDSVHVNAEFHDQASDHDPQVARLKP
jgi:predicted extracellular nuclease